MDLFGEKAALEPVARRKRYEAGLKHIPVKDGLRLADVGCGFEPNLLKFLLDNYEGSLEKYVGIDPLLPKEKSWKERDCQVSLRKIGLETKIPLKPDSMDCVTAFAFLEHVSYPDELLVEAVRVVKKGGRVVVTAPSSRAKFVLETLSFKLGLISKREIAEHKRYFDRESLVGLLPKGTHGLSAKHGYFEWGLNNIMVVEKN